MSKNKHPMTPKDASRIQSHSDRTDTNKSFAARAQSSAARKENTRKGRARSKRK